MATAEGDDSLAQVEGVVHLWSTLSAASSKPERGVALLERKLRSNMRRVIRRILLQVARLFPSLSIAQAVVNWQWLTELEIMPLRFFRGTMDYLDQFDRYLFIHTPKCGGTSARYHLGRNLGALPLPVKNRLPNARQSLEILRPDTAGVPVPSSGDYSVFVSLGDAYVEAVRDRGYRAVFPLGHLNLLNLRPHYRPERDRFLTLVREPREILESLLLFRVMRILQFPEREESQQRLAHLGLDVVQLEQQMMEGNATVQKGLLEREKFSLCHRYLLPGQKPELGSIMRNFRDYRVAACLPQEQSRMFELVLGPSKTVFSHEPRNTTAAVRNRFAVEPSVIDGAIDPLDQEFFERLRDTGLVGKWRDFRTVEDYFELLSRSV